MNQADILVSFKSISRVFGVVEVQETVAEETVIWAQRTNASTYSSILLLSDFSARVMQ